MASFSHEALYKAASCVRTDLSRQWFPKYNQGYLDSQTGVKRWLIQAYNQVHNGFSALFNGISFVSGTMFALLPNMSGLAILHYPKKIYNWILPRNPINQKRQFPRSIDKVLGDWIFYPMHTAKYALFNSRVPEKKSQKVESVMGKIVSANEDLLNPQNLTFLDYRVQTVFSSQINAFSVPGGGMVVYSRLVDDLENSIQKNLIKEAKISLPDGNIVIVSLEDVTVQDALAALMGHEIVHAAASHSIVKMISNVFYSSFVQVARFFVVQALKNKDFAYRRLKQDESSLIPSQIKELRKKEEAFLKTGEGIALVLNWTQDLFNLFHSKQCEIEADVVGSYLAKQGGYNPLGAIYIQEFLMNEEGSFSQFLHKWFEPFFSHPYGEKRKLAILSAVSSFSSECLRNKVYIEGRPEKKFQCRLRTAVENAI